MRPHPIVKCSKPLTANASAAPLDVVKMKSALGALGHYEAPEWGVSQFPDVALFDAIKAFQKSQGLKVDGAIKPDGETEAALSQAMTPRRAQTALQTTAQALQSLGRGGDELLAHITKEEAALLHNVTDGATINPQTGLLEFWYDYEADAAGVGSAADNRGRDSYGSDRDNDGWGNSISNPGDKPAFTGNEGQVPGTNPADENGNKGQKVGAKSQVGKTVKQDKHNRGGIFTGWTDEGETLGSNWFDDEFQAEPESALEKYAKALMRSVAPKEKGPRSKFYMGGIRG